jgi:succinate dehydrogenase / fumarate reductase cytochrome b subunit
MNPMNPIKKFMDPKTRIVNKAKWYSIAPAVIIFAGILVILLAGFNLGLDFTGGRIVKISGCLFRASNHGTLHRKPLFMSELASAAQPARPEIRNLNLFRDLPTYRMPLAGYVSILHRISGVLLFVALPFLVWVFAASISSEVSYARFTSAFSAGLWILPGWLVKLAGLALIWCYLHHFCAGLRYLYMDATHVTSKEFGRNSAVAVLLVSLLLTAVFGAKLFGAW